MVKAWKDAFLGCKNKIAPFHIPQPSQILPDFLARTAAAGMRYDKNFSGRGEAIKMIAGIARNIAPLDINKIPDTQTALC